MEEEKQNKTLLWDCGSTLYDSFELNSFRNQLNSAIANSPRALSMPHLPPQLPLIQLQPPQQKKPLLKISRSFHKFIRSVFKPSSKSSTVSDKYSKEGFYASAGFLLTTIPEVPEFEIGALSPPPPPEFSSNSLVGRSASERFMATTAIGISCA